MPIDIDVIIVGGGLSGLATARGLAKQNTPFVLLEARNRLGGRVLSPATTSSNTNQPGGVDLGPSWFWPGQRRMETLIRETGLSDSVFPQYSEGHSAIEYANGKLETGHGSASMAGSNRLDGGIGRLINRLAESLPAENIRTDTTVTKVTRTADGIKLSANQNNTEITIDARQVIFALPPRVVAETMSFEPAIENSIVSQLASKATWMAAHAKFVAVYATPFWRDHGLSGDGLSQQGPLVEIHDASPKEGGPYALFGFLGIPASHRKGQDQAITQLAVDQLNRMFGQGTNHQPIDVHYKDWAYDPLTATAGDREAPANHHGRIESFSCVWDDKVIFSGTETAEGHGQSNGYLEGALESAERALGFIA